MPTRRNPCLRNPPSRTNPSWFDGGSSRAHPMKGLDAVEQFEKVRWGNRATYMTRVTTPALTRAQCLVGLGKLRALLLCDAHGHCFELHCSRPYPWLAFGERDNRLYICGGSTDKEARRHAWGKPGCVYTVCRVDYDANKGGKDVYWYHHHERPFPKLRILRSGHPAYVGGRYKVAPDGIVG